MMEEESDGMLEDTMLMDPTVMDEEVIALYEAMPLNLDSIMLEPSLLPINEVDLNLHSPETSFSDLETLAPAEISPESLSVTAPPPGFSGSSGYSPSSSSFSLGSPEDPESFLYSPSSYASGAEESTEVMVTPSKVCVTDQIPPKKKRGRKPKSGDGSCAAASKSVKIKRLKVYEMTKPFEDRDREKKRVNAIKAKKHRDSQKKIMEQMRQQLTNMKAERDELAKERDRLRIEVRSFRLKDYDAEREFQKKELENERRKVAEITRKYEVFKRHWQYQASHIIKLLQKPPEF